MSSSSTAVNPQTPGLKTCFKIPEGRYKLHYEKTTQPPFYTIPMARPSPRLHQLVLWDLARPSGWITYICSRSHSAHWYSVIPLGSLQPSPSMQDVPEILPLVAHRAHADPLSSAIFANESIVTISREAHIKICKRPCHRDNSQSNSSNAVIPITNLKDIPVASFINTNSSDYNQPTPVISS